MALMLDQQRKETHVLVTFLKGFNDSSGAHVFLARNKRVVRYARRSSIDAAKGKMTYRWI